jgi:hypothetical protein
MTNENYLGIPEDDVKALMRSFAARRKTEDRPCAVCGKIMEAVIGKRRYCSVACHSKAARTRRKEDPAQPAAS